MISADLQGRATALAAITQSIEVAFDLARVNRLSTAPLLCLTESLFQINPDSTRAIYAAGDQLALGVSRCKERLDAPMRQDEAFLSTGLQITGLAKKLLSQPATQQSLRAGLEAAALYRAKASSADAAQAEAEKALADLYQEHVSPLGPKIILRGEPRLLQQPEIAAKIRTVLLAGVRAAVLWRQLGGTPWQLIFKREQLKRALNTIA
jgi:high frequency lysogenization protein